MHLLKKTDIDFGQETKSYVAAILPKFKEI